MVSVVWTPQAGQVMVDWRCMPVFSVGRSRTSYAMLLARLNARGEFWTRLGSGRVLTSFSRSAYGRASPWSAGSGCSPTGSHPAGSTGRPALRAVLPHGKMTSGVTPKARRRV